MSVIITPGRVDHYLPINSNNIILNPLHHSSLLGHGHGHLAIPSGSGLLPSAMPPPPPSISPRTKTYDLPISRNHQITSGYTLKHPFTSRGGIGTSSAIPNDQNIPIMEIDDVFMVSSHPSRTSKHHQFASSSKHPLIGGSTKAAPRDAITENNHHHHHHQSSLRHSVLQTQSQKLSTKVIPRPATTPDVFAADPPLHTSQKAPLANRSTNLLLGNGHTGSTTTTNGQKRSRETNSLASRAENTSKRARHEQAKLEEQQWKAKWTKSFPSLIFHIEIGAEESAKGLKPRIKQMGAKIDQFFSQRVTHLIVKNTGSPTKPKPQAVTRRGDPARDSPKNPFVDRTGTTDLVQKAEALGIKVWTVKKLGDILSRLAPVEVAVHDSLSTLLEDEKLHGTRERDLTAPRPDWYYFKPFSKYLLIEDAFTKHRPIMVKEYNATSSKDPTEYPTLFESFMRPSSSSITNTSIDKLRDRAWTLFVERKSFEGEAPPATLHRSASLRSFPGTPRLPAPAPYQNASGNSVVITSNIASMSTSANPSPAFPTLGNKGALSQMSKRVQVLKNNTLLRQEIPNRRASLGASSTSTNAVAAPKTFMTQEQLIKMLNQAREPICENVSAEDRRANKAKVDAGIKRKEQDTAPGYCENCRVKYTCLTKHIQSNRHRRFALDNNNFLELDQLLETLQRPLRPDLQPCDFPPCWKAHLASDPCGLCISRVDEMDSVYDSQESGSIEGSEEEEGSLEGEEGEEEEAGSLEGDDEGDVDGASVEDGDAEVESVESPEGGDTPEDEGDGDEEEEEDREESEEGESEEEHNNPFTYKDGTITQVRVTQVYEEEEGLFV